MSRFPGKFCSFLPVKCSLCQPLAATVLLVFFLEPWTSGTSNFSKEQVHELYVKRVQEYSSTFLPVVTKKFRELWTSEELESIFEGNKYLLSFEWRCTAYGIGLTEIPEGDLVDALRLLAGAVGSRSGKVVESTKVLNFSSNTGSRVLETCTTSPEQECQFRSEIFHTIVVDYIMKETRESDFHGFPGWTSRTTLAKVFSLVLEDMGLPGIQFVEVPSVSPMATKLTLQKYVGSPSMTFALNLEISGPCAAPFTLEKETALRMVVRNLLGPKLNVFYTRVKQVSVSLGASNSSEANVTIVVGIHREYVQPNISEAIAKVVDRDISGGQKSLLMQEFEKMGMTLDNVDIRGVDILNGDPPETTEDWWIHHGNVLRAAERSARSKEYAVSAALVFFLGAFGIVVFIGLRQQRTMAVPLVQPLPPAPISRTLSRQLSSPSSTESIWQAEYIPQDDIQLVRDPDTNECHVLGRGSSGAVYLAHLEEVHVVAVKVMSGAGAETRVRDHLLREVDLLRSCRHSHIVQFQGVSFVDDDIWLVMEFLAGGDLFGALSNRTDFKWYARGGQVALDIACGLAYLHNRHIIHLDVKTANVLLTSDGRAKIGDVGLARLMTALQTHASMQMPVGTLEYMAPEILVAGRASQSADIFSFGVILWEIITGERPRRGFLRNPSVPEDCPQEIADLLNHCLHPDPSERPTASDIVILLRNQLGSSRQPMLPPAGTSREHPSLPSIGELISRGEEGGGTEPYVFDEATGFFLEDGVRALVSPFET